ncbi:hypothetical protein Bpfe_028783, partial [Biomphalaria pfeifferi]
LLTSALNMIAMAGALLSQRLCKDAKIPKGRTGASKREGERESWRVLCMLSDPLCMLSAK